jgi:hypothetical protein
MESETRHLMNARLVALALVFLAGVSYGPAAWARPVCTEVPIPHARRYENFDYQFTVMIPRRFQACKLSSPCPNHGVRLPLSVNATCSSDQQSPSITVDAYYNAGSEVDTPDHEPARTPAQLAAIQCPRRDARNVAWLKGERLGGRDAAGCRRDFPDGHIEVSIIALRKTEAWAARWIEISADLSTTPERYEADMRVFDDVLKGVRIHADGPLE